MTGLPTMPDFAAHLHEHFLVELVDQTAYPLELIEVTTLPASGAPGAPREPFQMKFRGPGPGYLPQQIHLLHNEALGPCSLFLVPIAQDKDGFVYQAIFN